jgi:hypothetical protein
MLAVGVLFVFATLSGGAQPAPDVPAAKSPSQKARVRETKPFKDLDSTQKAAVASVNADKSLSPAQRACKLADIKEDFAAARKGTKGKSRSRDAKVKKPAPPGSKGTGGSGSGRR